MSSPAKKPKTNKYSEKRYYKQNKKQVLDVGMRGYLATCNFREKECVRECYNILNEYTKILYKNEYNEESSVTSNTVNEGSDDIADKLQQDIASTTDKQKSCKTLFQAVDVGTTNCVFIRTTLPDPVELGFHIVSDIATKGLQKTRFLLRLIPIEIVCKANMPAILKAAEPFIDKHFSKSNTTFSIAFNKRYNNEINRDDCITQLAEMINSKNPNNRVDLKNPNKTVIVEIAKSFCCFSVVEKYFQYKRYNLVELGSAKETVQSKIVKDGESAASMEIKDKDSNENATQCEIPGKVDDDIKKVDGTGEQAIPKVLEIEQEASKVT